MRIVGRVVVVVASLRLHPLLELWVDDRDRVVSPC